VCIEAEGTCVAEAALIFVSESGIDAGSCTQQAPCRSITFAQSLATSSRRIVRLLGGQLSLGGLTTSINTVIDGSNTNIVANVRPIFAVTTAATLEGVRIASSSFSDTVISVTAGGALKLASSTIDSAEIRVDAGSVDLTATKLVNAELDCRAGMINVRRSTIERSLLDSENCRLSVTRSRLGPAGPAGTSMIRGGGLFTIENNLFTETIAGRSAMAIFGFDIGSTVRFNTIINFTPGPQTILCPDGLSFTSNILATNSSNPIGPCIARNTLFDAVGDAAAAAGPNNVVGESATFFRNPLADDFRLTSGSQAIGIGDPDLVTTDFDGNPRPAPAGSLPDVGAYEAP
jgi:hypothetical protein